MPFDGTITYYATLYQKFESNASLIPKVLLSIYKYAGGVSTSGASLLTNGPTPTTLTFGSYTSIDLTNLSGSFSQGDLLLPMIKQSTGTLNNFIRGSVTMVLTPTAVI